MEKRTYKKPQKKAHKKDNLAFLKDHIVEIGILIFSVLTIILGSRFVGLIKAILLVAGIDICMYLPTIIKKFRSKNKKKTGSKNSKAKNIHWKNILKVFIILCFVGFISLMVIVCAFFYMIVKEAPKFDPERLYRKDASILYGDDGKIYAKLGEEKREKITYDEMSEVLIDAIVATEDSRFFQHNGFDLPRFLKASLGQLLGRDAGGASTITMQVSKNNFTSTEAEGWEGIKRKFTDIYISIFQIEKRYTKQQILEFYANSYNLGAGAWGVEQASQTYFGKSARDLNLAEAAMIAGLFQAPSLYNPYVNPELTKKRQETVLYLMQRHGYITKEERDAAAKIPIESLLSDSVTSNNQYLSYIDTVVSEVIRKTGKDPYVVPMEIYTNFNKAKQDHINSIMNGETFAWENDVVNAGVAVVDTNTGAIVAIGAGRNYFKANAYNYATDIRRQIGSTAKPLYDYGPAIEYNNWSTYTPLIDEEHNYSSGNGINNWDGNFLGLMTTRYALIKSRNVPALKTFQSVSNAKIKEFVTNLGLHPELEGNIVHEAHAIGGYNGEAPLYMAAAYAAFGNGGYYTEPYSVNKIVFRETGEVYEEKPQKKRVMSEETAYMIVDMLVDTAKDALGGYANVNGINYAAKTGTTNFPDSEFAHHPNWPASAINDLWVASTNTDYSISVWYGYDHNYDDYVTRFGSTQHAQLFQAVAKGIYADKTGFKQPRGVVEVEVEKDCYPDALLPSEYTPANMRIKELFKKGTEPTKVSDRYAKLKDATNLDSSVSGSTVTISWDAIKTPNDSNYDYLVEYYKKLYKNPDDQVKYLGMHVNYNDLNIGLLGYDIYIKNSDDTLTHLDFTTDTSYEYHLKSNSPVTFVVKTAYSIYKANASDGAELKVSLNGVQSVITASLNGDETVKLKIGDTYEEENPAVIVLENLVDVSNKANIITTIKKDNKTVSSISTDSAATYEITYTVTYNNFKETLKRTVIVE